MAISALGAFRPAQAQGTFGTLPDPITSRELEDYSDRLGLSDLQRQAVLSAHDGYREQFRLLREGEIEKFLSDTQGFRGGMAMLQMNRRDVDKALRGMNSVMAKIAGLDSVLFDQMQAVLTEEQAAMMPRVRQMRERSRYSSGLTRAVSFLNPATRADLSALVQDIDLTLAERQAIDPALASYESGLTQAVKRLHDGALDMVTEVMDKLEKQGFDLQNMQDQQRRGQLFEAFRTVWAEVSGKLSDKAMAISTLNRRTLSELTAQLSAENAARLRNTYLQRAYPEAFSGQNSASRGFRAALAFDDLSPEQRESISAMAAEFHASDDRMTDQLVAVIDDNRKNANPMEFDGGRRRQYDEKVDDLRNKRRALGDSAMESLKTALGPELTSKLERRVAEGRDDNNSSRISSRVAVNVGGGGTIGLQVTPQIATTETVGAMADPYIPGPISERSVLQYAALLGIDRDNDQLAVLDGLHETYRERYGAIDETELKAVREATSGLWSGGQGGQFRAPTPEAIDNLYALRRKALASIMAADEAFFDNIQSVILSTEDAARLERARLVRKRDIYNRSLAGNSFMGRGNRDGGGRRGGDNNDRGPRGGRGPGGRAFSFFGGGSNQESSIDLAALVDRLDLTGEQRAKTDAVLVEYERTIAAAFEKNYEAALKRQQAMDKMMAAASQNQGGDGQRRGGGDRGPERGGDRGPGNAFREMMENEGRAAREASNEIVTLNKATLPHLVEVLPPAEAEGLRVAYNQKAFPNVYNDSRSAVPHITAALKLEDLSPQQRSLIDTLSLEYRSNYDQLSEQLVKLSASAVDFTAGAPNQQRDWQAIAEQQRVAEKVSFDRDELSDKTMAKLRAVLNDEQSQNLGIDRDETAR